MSVKIEQSPFCFRESQSSQHWEAGQSLGEPGSLTMETCLTNRNQWKKNQCEIRIPLLEISNLVTHLGITHSQPAQARHILEHVRTQCRPCFYLIFLLQQLNSSPTRTSQKVPLATWEFSSSLQHAWMTPVCPWHSHVFLNMEVTG